MQEDVVDAMEVGEVGIDLNDPVWLDKDDGADVEEADGPGEKGFVLHPRNNVMEGPGHVERNGANGQPPIIDRNVEEDGEALPNAEDELEYKAVLVRRDWRDKYNGPAEKEGIPRAE